MTGEHAKLCGHANPKQKIRYTMKLKEEINRLFTELKKARSRIVELELSTSPLPGARAAANEGDLAQGVPYCPSILVHPSPGPSPKPTRRSLAASSPFSTSSGFGGRGVASGSQTSRW
mmetsp:Transcript_22389/g.30746  ORF Transcript_22389/g.30746 Transcript_22389/m.30746 type:complete len:118 (-) Transcript_22389:101-454(-)